MKTKIKYSDDCVSWAKWLRKYGAEKFYMAFMRNAQGAEGQCIQCERYIYLDIREGGGVPDWRTSDGDYGCDKSPDNDEESTGSHSPAQDKSF